MIKRCLLCDECEEFGGILPDDGSADEVIDWLIEHEEWRLCDGEILCEDCAAAFAEAQDDDDED